MSVNEYQQLGRSPRDIRNLSESIIAAAMDAIIAVDDAQRIVLFNAAAERIFACPANEALGSSVERFIPQRFRAGHSMRVRRFAESGITSRTLHGLGTLWGLRATGEEFPLEASISKVRSGGKTLFTTVIRDISERYRAEEALRASEERLRLAQQAARIGTFEWNIQTGVNTWTPELEAIYGLPPGGFGGTQTAFENLVHPDDRAGVIKLDDWALKTGQSTNGEWRVVWSDGSVHWIAGRWQVFKDESGEPSRMVGINIDITDRKRGEEALLEMNRTLEAQGSLLRSREELLRVFVKNVPAAVAMLDRDMRYLQVSDRWCSDYFPGRAEILGRSHYEIFPDMPERWKEVHCRALQGETVRSDEDRWDGQDGPHWARWEVRPWKTAEGAVGGILILAEDITRRKQMEEALSDLSRKLMDAQEQERARIGRELHDDINQRLAALAIQLEQLEQDPSDVQNLARNLRIQATEISNDVQALSHELHASKLEYLGVIKGMKSWCKEFAERQKLEIEFSNDMSSALQPEIGVSLFRVLQEALQNAVKHSGVKRFEVYVREDSGEIHLIVRDSGKGFEVQAALQGKGLGLTSMRERVRLMKGTISIESKPMGGTTIHVRVPLDGTEIARKQSA